MSNKDNSTSINKKVFDSKKISTKYKRGFIGLYRYL